MTKQKAKKVLTTTAPEDTFRPVELITAQKMSAERLKELGLKTWEHPVVPTQPLPRTLKKKMAAEILNRYLDTKVKLKKIKYDTSAAYRNANRKQWEAIRDALKLHHKEGVPIHPEMAQDLEAELEYWLLGIPSFRLPLLTSRGYKTSPPMHSCKLIAVMYLAASPTMSYSKELTGKVIKAYQNGIELDTIADKIGKSVLSVSSKLVREGVDIDKPEAVSTRRKGPTRKKLLSDLEGMAPFEADGGFTGDRRARQTVKNYYSGENSKIAKSTIQNWINELYPEAVEALADFYPEKSNKKRSKFLTLLLKKSGGHFVWIKEREIL